MIRSLGALAVLLLALPLVAVPMAKATEPVPGPWWPEPGAGPEDLHSLWNLRIPLRIENPGPSPLPAGWPAQAHLDLGALLVEAGWPASNGVPKSFSLDPDSLRLVEATSNWVGIRGERPVAVSTTWFEPTQARFGKTQDAPFHPQRNALVTLEWRLASAVASGSAGYYHLYFETLQNSDRPAAEPSQAGVEDLEAMHWIGAGTRVYGYHPGSSTPAPTLVIIAARDDTHVSVLAHRGSPQPILDNRPGSGNPVSPFALDGGQAVRYSLGTGETGFVVVADGPVVVVNHAASPTSTGEFVPSLDGTLRGGRFLFPAIATSVRVIAPGDLPGPVQVCHGLAGTAGSCASLSPGRESRIAIPQPFPAPPQLDPARLHEVVANAPVLVQYDPAPASSGAASTAVQLPSQRGSPVGDRFLGATAQTPDGGYTVRSWHEAADFVVARDQFLAPPVPVTPVLHTEQAWLPLAIAGTDLPAVDSTSGQTPVLAVTRTGTDPGGLLQVQAGERGNPDVDQATAFGGRRGMDFTVTGPFAVLSQYDTTLVSTVPLGDVPASIQMEQDSFQAFAVGRSEVTRITSDKPVAVLPYGDPGRYLRFMPVRPAAAVPTILPGEYRGYLVDIEPEGDVEPLFFNGRPGQTIEIPFNVRNLARWSDGRPLPDFIHLSATAVPADFPGSIVFPQPVLDLDDATPTRSSLQVALPKDLPPDSSVTIAVRATSEQNPQMWAEFTAIVFSRQTYGVELWWGDASSASHPHVLPLRLPPGSVQDLPFVARNSGSGPDAIDLTVGALPPGWTAQILRGDVPLGSRTPVLEPGGSGLPLELRVRVSETAQVGAITLPVDGASTASPTTADRLLLNARLALGQSVDLSSAEPVLPIAPGGAADFTAKLSNSGQDSISLALSMRNSLPSGWTAVLHGAGASGGSIALLPGQSIDLPVRISAPVNATAKVIGAVVVEARGTGDSVALHAALSLAAIVDAVHGVTLQAPATLHVTPGANHTLPLLLHNKGNGNETIRLSVEAAPGAWAFILPNPVGLARNRTASPAVVLTVPPGFPAGTSTVRIAATGAMGPLADAAIAVQVAEDHRLLWTGNATPLLLQPGEHARHSLRLENRGNMPERVILEAAAPAGWTVTAEGAAFELAQGASMLVTFAITVPQDAVDSQRIEAVARLASDPTPARAPFEVIVDRPRLEVLDVQALGQARQAGDVVLVAASFSNPSRVPLAGAEVRLLAGNATLDVVRFDSVGGQANVTAVLRWIVEDPEADLRIAWGLPRPAGFEEFGSMAVDGAAGDAARPAPAAPFLAALALALAARRRRQA